MFGDLFCQRDIDYRTGFIYSTRRRFLVGSGQDVFEPPDEFKTKHQQQRKLHHEKMMKEKYSEGKAPIAVTLATKPAARRSSMNYAMLRAKSSFLTTKRRFASAATAVVSAVVIDHYSSVEPSDWEEQQQAGCHLWVNKTTGEVSTECPWKPINSHLWPRASEEEAMKELQEEQELAQQQQAAGEDDDDDYGTGALVYDSKEVDDLFAMLDNAK